MLTWRRCSGCSPSWRSPPLAGCKNKKADCEQAAQHVVEIANAELEQRLSGADPALREKIAQGRASMPASVEAARKRCQAESWSRSKFDCIMAAKTMREVSECH